MIVIVRKVQVKADDVTFSLSLHQPSWLCPWSWLPVASCRLPIQSATGKWQLTSHYRCQFAILTNWLPIAKCRLPIQSATGKWQLTSHSGCGFANSSELATGNWHPDANSIWESLKLNRNLQTAARCRFAHSSELATGKWQPDANSIWEGFKRLKLKRKLANGSRMSIHYLFRTGNW